MRRIQTLTLALAFLPASTGHGDPPASESAKPVAVEELLHRLSDGVLRVRNDAARTILTLGAEALPKLLEARNSLDPELRRRVEELIPQLERKFLLEPKIVSLHMTNRPMRDVLSELCKQTGYKIAPWDGGFAAIGPGGVPLAAGTPANGQAYSFHFDKLPFWQALDRVCESSGMVLQQNYWGDDFLRLYAADSYVPFNSYSGPFKVMATGFNYNRNNNFSELARSAKQRGPNFVENLSLNLSIAVEPRLPILRLGAAKITEAVDAEGHSLIPSQGAGVGPSASRYYYGGWYRAYVQQVQVNLDWPAKSVRTIKVLRGSVPVSILADQRPALITEKLLTAKGKRFKLEGASFHVEDVQEMGGKQYQIRLAITEALGDNQQDWTRINSLQQRLELLDAKGNKYQFYFNTMNNNGSTTQVTLMAQPPGPNIGPPTKLVYHSWNVMETEVPFEFHGLPLPDALAGG